MIVLFEELIEIDTKLFEDETEMCSEDEMGIKINDMCCVSRGVCAMKDMKDIDFDPCLVEVSGLVFNNLDGDDF